MAVATGSIRCLTYLMCVALVSCSYASYKTGDNDVTIASLWTGIGPANEESPMMSVFSNGTELLKEKLGLDDEGLAAERQEAEEYFLETFGINVTELVENDEAVVFMYQTSPIVTIKALVSNLPCRLPGEGLDYVEVGMLVTLTTQITVTDQGDSSIPPVVYIPTTTFVYGYKFIDLTHCESVCKCENLPEHLKLRFRTTVPFSIINRFRTDEVTALNVFPGATGTASLSFRLINENVMFRITVREFMSLTIPSELNYPENICPPKTKHFVSHKSPRLTTSKRGHRYSPHSRSHSLSPRNFHHGPRRQHFGH